MSINVTVNGNPVNIRGGRMMLSDLDQIKKNERDRRRRLRLEQVRQQSKEISNRVLERAKHIAKEELQKLGKCEQSNLKQMHDRKILDIQQKYQEDMADIGLAHACAALESDYDLIIEEERKKNRQAALKRGKEAAQQMKEMQETETCQQLHQERLRQVRELEDLRSTMVAKLPQKVVPEKHTTCNAQQERTSGTNSNPRSAKKKKTKKLLAKKSPGKIIKSHSKVAGSEHSKTSPLLNSKERESSMIRSKGADSVVEQKSTLNRTTEPSTLATETQQYEDIEEITESKNDETSPRKTVPILNITPTKADKIASYNPEDYTQETSNSTGSGNSTPVSDDSSYFSDSSEKAKCVRVPKHHNSPAEMKVRLYDHNTHQRNVYDKPVGVVEKIDARNEPSAIDLAREVQQAESRESQLVENRKSSARKRGEDALLREKVRRDYHSLMQNLDHFAREERKLKASQIQHYPKDVCMREEQRRMLRDHHKKRLNRALKVMLSQSSPEQCPSYPTERVITLTPRKSEETADCIPHSSWQNTCCVRDCTETSKDPVNKGKEDNRSREEQILDMLKKVEKQKRLLLQEFGADLPNNIFNASIKPLFETEKSVVQPPVTPQQEPVASEITVINMSSCDENIQNDKLKQKSKSPVKKSEIAVQTTEMVKSSAAQDKGVQVELTTDKRTEFQSTSRDTDTPTTKQYPIEPKVTVITPELDSNESTTSVVTSVTIDVDKQEVSVTPKKKRTNTKSSKRIPSKVFQKSRSVPASKTSSPLKRYSKSLPESRQSSPRKTRCSMTDSPRKRIDIYVNKTGFNIKVEPSQPPRVDASTQSSQMYSIETQDPSTDKPYRIQSQSKRVIRIRDTSDTSTSFASPPPVQPRDMLEALKDNTPILEMLDSSANETLRRLKRDISPVSTPETPSPRTMRIPSNVPHPDRITRILLKYISTDSQTNESSILSSTKNNQSTSTDASHFQTQEHVSSQYTVTASKQQSISSHVCVCKNPECKLMHTKLDDIQDYALKNCPQILKKYEDLQNMCTERIASLTDLIEKVRNEQKGMEFSVISAADETTLLQLPPPKPMSNDLQSVRRLVESIEAIHNQLAKTLIESQRIIKNEVILEEQTNHKEQAEAITLPSESTSIDVTTYMEPEFVKTKAKPKIISEEKVNIQLDRFKTQRETQAPISAPMTDRNSWPSQTFYEDDTIEKISKEILEQSKGLSKSNNNASSLKDMNNSSTKRIIETSTSINEPKSETSPIIQRDISTMKRESTGNESTKYNDFIPLLAGIPKVPRTVGNSASTSGRGKPPITLHSAPYRAEIESSGHELSTIVEFDTPDTVNKSQNNIKSPPAVKRSTETQVTKSSIVVKPSVHVAPLFALHNQHLTAGKHHNSPSTKLPLPLPTHRSQETATTCDSPKASKTTKESNISTKTEDEKWRILIPETSNKKLQCDTANQDLLLQTEDLQPLSSISIISTDANNQKNNKERITSTSSNSFSGLSGISEILSTPSSDLLKYASSPEEMETALKKSGLGWLITTLKKTREASALSSSSNSDVTPVNTARRMISPAKKQLDSNCGLPDFSDVSSISIKEASKSTEQAVLLKGRTSTPKLQNSNSNSARTNTSSTNSSDNCHEPSDSLIVPNVSLTKAKSNIKQLESL